MLTHADSYSGSYSGVRVELQGYLGNEEVRISEYGTDLLRGK